jgi:hypothetical protein
MMTRYIGKRFGGLILVGAALTAGFFAGPIEAFPSFATTLGLLYTVYVGGQSATDWKNATYVGAPK